MERRRTSELQKRSFFVDAVNSLDVKLLNTWGEKSIHNWTCAYEYREARQIDFFGVSRSFAHHCTVQMYDSAATNSDHRAFLLSVKGRPRSRIMTRRKQPKPIGWYVRTGRTVRTSKRLATLFPLVLVQLMAAMRGTCGVMGGLAQLR